MKKKIWISIGVVLLIAVLVGINVANMSNKEDVAVETAKVEEREITGNVMVPGTLSLSEEDFLYLDPERGELTEILVKEGDKIEEGTPLLRYENEQLKLEKEQNALSLESAYLQINQIKDKIADLDENEKELAKEVGEEEAKKQIKAEREQLKVDLKVADLEARQVVLQKETLEKSLADLEVKSKIAGTVLSVDEDAKEGTVQTPILHIGKADSYIVKGYISEYDSLKIKEKQPVIIKSDAIPDQEWKGTVTKVSLLPEQTDAAMGSEDTAVQYPIEVAIEATDFEAKPGFKLIMDIETDKRKVKSVPLEAVKQDGEENYVFVIDNGKALRKEVEVGPTSNEYMEVKTGLEAGEEVIVSPPINLTNGMEVNKK
ncbi:efflux RND transporter periplasmic adaptor subunit [Metabacillus malikii]|uniref:HlyD family secretion protein n=1 Tax=Metabacillus malikii TaxID=1504265 RepID=A0ABT9ZGF1_9BACI|nr:efflux RND transporter periplasmic adaptor subunit [Metabacillus malikii]MDQ0231358.1 HlyD family secretion protein [Metabacillus malikii]